MTDFRKLFKREMFESYMRDDIQAEKAQSILNEALDKATKVYASKSQGWQWTESRCDMDTHEGLLIQVEDIKECEHIPIKQLGCSHFYYYCQICKKELIPTGFKVKNG